MNKLKVLAAAVLLAGCAAQTGIVPIGNGLYMSSRDDYMGTSGSRVKAQLYAEAAAFCSKQGKSSVPVADTSHDPQFPSANWASAEVKFRCE